jgi:hypothetical protein
MSNLLSTQVAPTLDAVLRIHEGPSPTVSCPSCDRLLAVLADIGDADELNGPFFQEPAEVHIVAIVDADAGRGNLFAGGDVAILAENHSGHEYGRRERRTHLSGHNQEPLPRDNRAFRIHYLLFLSPSVVNRQRCS